MKTVFEISKPDNRAVTFKQLEVKKYYFDQSEIREKPMLPELSEIDLVRHYMALSRRAFGVDNGFYPLGSCTMKYNPKLNESIAGLDGFLNVHPSISQADAKGSMNVCGLLSEALNKITGMDATTLLPSAGAHGEYTGLLLIKKYHLTKGDLKRTKVLIPSSAHGTNPASATMAGFEVVNVKSDINDGVDLEDLERLAGDDTACLMLTNPNTLGMFEKNIRKIANIIHKVGGLLYYDGANLNAIMGYVRPGDMGFDVCHLNLHKTFSTPHGGGGPGSGPVCCKSFLADFLPYPITILKDGEYRYEKPKQTIGKVGAYYGNFGVYIKALAYILTLGGDGLKEASGNAVLNANYLRKQIANYFPPQGKGFCMHEFVVSVHDLKEKCGVSALDIAKGMIDGGIHPPTMYFPLIVDEALMFEPTETESKETLDKTVKIMKNLYQVALESPDSLKNTPYKAPISRPNEVQAARTPKLIFKRS